MSSSEFQVGDFVRLRGNIKIGQDIEAYRLVLSMKDIPPEFLGMMRWYVDGETEKDYIAVFYLLADAERISTRIARGRKEEYVYTPPTTELIFDARNRLESAYTEKEIDNLTYLEICARLREHEKQI